MGKGKAHKDSRRLALRWEKVPLVRSRVRKGKDWIKLSYLDNGEVVFCTKTIQTNHQVLLTLLEEFGLKSKTIDFLVEQAWLSKFVFVIRGSKEFLYNIYSSVSRNSFDSLFRPTAPQRWEPFSMFWGMSRTIPSKRTWTLGIFVACFRLPAGDRRMHTVADRPPETLSFKAHT